MSAEHHILLLNICKLGLEDAARQGAYDVLRQWREADKIDATFRDYFKRGFVTTDNWRTATLTAAGEERGRGEQAIAATRSVIH